MKIDRFDTESKGHFTASDEGIQAGRMTYSWAGSDKIIIDHTEVKPAFSGKGVGKMLVLEAVNFARENNLTILPLCPFARSVFDRNDDLSDVLDQPVP